MKKEKLKELFEKYWSLIGFIIAVISITYIIVNRQAFFKNHNWMLWAFIPMLMLHNFEESFFPGGFLPWFNKTCFKSDQDYFPSGKTPAAIFGIVNCWLLTFLSALLADKFIYLAVVMVFFFVQNAWMHISYSFSTKSPGVITSFILLAPFSAFILYTLISTGRINFITLIIGYIVGSLLHYNMFSIGRRVQKKKQLKAV